MFKAKESRLAHRLVKQHDGKIESPPWWHTQSVHLLWPKPNVDQCHRNFTSPNSHRLGDTSRTVQKETLECLLLWHLSWLHPDHAGLAGASFVPFSVVKNGARIRVSHSGIWWGQHKHKKTLSSTPGMNWLTSWFFGWMVETVMVYQIQGIHLFFFSIFFTMVLSSVSKFISDLCLYKFFSFLRTIPRNTAKF